MDKTEVLLKECIDSLLEEEIKEIPKDADIKKQHRFSKKFIKSINKLIQTNKKKKIYRMYKALGACAAVLILAVLAANRISYFYPAEETVMMENAVKEVGEDAADMMAENSMDMAEEATQDSAALMTQESSMVKSSYGDDINVDDIKSQPVGMKVSAVYNRERGWILCEQIQNNSDKPVQFMEGSYMLEVWQEDGWYVFSTKEEAKVYSLEPGSRSSSNILAEGVTLEPGKRYRMLSMFDGEMKGYVFSLE